ncbi:hypothetical protein K402DRAFT_406018 [Aulographum hederae CBS 113979]|uniref:Vacuolar segregation subunit 7-domain-containing protein n=1 Tax=Aulographum hederae CBS 113979 TaxID=1176131 RepID=A0A6G1GU61_9PEZI|nr:hypothetical protein K402DRAFT_406018 [Aulographum hederae CBS 113979]
MRELFCSALFWGPRLCSAVLCIILTLGLGECHSAHVQAARLPADVIDSFCCYSDKLYSSSSYRDVPGEHRIQTYSTRSMSPSSVSQERVLPPREESRPTSPDYHQPPVDNAASTPGPDRHLTISPHTLTCCLMPLSLHTPACQSTFVRPRARARARACGRWPARSPPFAASNQHNPRHSEAVFWQRLCASSPPRVHHRHPCHDSLPHPAAGLAIIMTSSGPSPDPDLPDPTSPSASQMPAPPPQPLSRNISTALPLSTPSSTTASTTSLPAKALTNPVPSPQVLVPTGSPATTSPRTSRDTSPTRLQHRSNTAGASSAARGLRSRKNSTDLSPHRPPSIAGTSPSVPSAAAIQRALSSASAPQLQPASPSELPSSSRLARPVRSTGASGESSPHHATTPRVKSPPPSNTSSRRNSLLSQRRAEAPNIVVQRSSPVSTTPPAFGKDDVPAAEPEEQKQGQMKNSARGASGAPTLATVQESSVPATPAFGSLESGTPTQAQYFGSILNEEAHFNKAKSRTTSNNGESGSDSGGNKSDGKAKKDIEDPERTPRPKAITAQSSYTSLSSLKSKAGPEQAPRNMTVETETVNSIPQAAMASNQGERSGAGRGDAGGSVRLRASTETIRPKKDRKKVNRKAPSIHSGTGMPHSPITFDLHHHHHIRERPNLYDRAQTLPFKSTASFSSHEEAVSPTTSSFVSLSSLPSSPTRTFSSRWSTIALNPTTNATGRKASSKADIFEAKVASAVDQANSSDSDETFVYESNPPDSQPRRSRNHSRTPSATSMASLADHRPAVRSIANVIDATRGVAGKRSMKFASNPYNGSAVDDDNYDRQDGTIRAHSRNSAANSIHHHHIGRQGRGLGGYGSILDDDSPFTQASKSRSIHSTNASRHNSRPPSPKFNGHHRLGSGLSKKSESYTSYDMDGEGADDERTPMVGTVRTPRHARIPRTPNSGRMRGFDEHYRRRRNWWSRFAGCMIMTIMLLIIIMGAVGFFVATTKAMYDVGVREIKNVLASEQEIMLDLWVEAINPNIMPVTVADMDVNLFAKSKHVGSEKWWREHGQIPSDTTRRRKRGTLGSSSSDDDSTDPTDPEGDSQTMLLGRIFHFDNALNFDGSPLKRNIHDSIGAIRLTKPGNKTEAGGTERWERVLNYPFELIVRGVLQYSLPLSSHTIKAPIGASIIVHPDKGVDRKGHMHVEPIGRIIDEDEDEEVEYEKGLQNRPQN